MTASRTLRLGCLVLLSTSACRDDEPMGPSAPGDPGPLELILESPFTDDGALLLTLGGGPIDSVAAPSLSIFAAEPAGDSRRVLIHGEIPPGPVLRVYVPDRRALPSYAVTLESAASSKTYAQRPTAEYVLTLQVAQRP